MVTTDVLFVFWFLPLTLGIYYLAKPLYRKYILLLVSLFFYACGAVEYFTLLCVSLGVNILLGVLISKTKKYKGISLAGFLIGICYNVGILFYYKYYDFFFLNLSKVLKTEFEMRNLLLPLGLSFFSFKAISYLVDIYNEKINVSLNPVDSALYLSFFAQVQSGPLSRYSDMYQICAGENHFENFSTGVCRFIIGFNKKVLLSNILANITTEIFDVSNTEVSSAYLWLGAICYSLQLFYDFAGYSDMAIGISNMFGYECPENFRYPYMTKSIAEFWRRWHITLGAWFRDYIYIPLGGSRVKSKVRLYVNLLAVWLLTGIWHGASWNFVFWGLGYFVLISFEKTVGWPEKINSNLGKGIYRIFTLLIINFQWVIFRSPGLMNGIRYIKGMLSFQTSELADARTLFLMRDYFAFIAAAILFATPVIPWVEKKVEKSKVLSNIYNVIFVISLSAMFLWALSYVIAGQNNPFAYANF